MRDDELEAGASVQVGKGGLENGVEVEGGVISLAVSQMGIDRMLR